MQADLSESLKRRLLLELREYWSKDPKYKDTLTQNIQGKYSFDQRPQQAIVLKGTSANPIKFSADHYQGIVVSYCTLFKAFGKEGSSIEWVKEDGRAIQKNDGVFPTAPGIYYIEIKKEVVDWRGVPAEYLVFYVDPLLEVVDERPTQMSPTTYTLSAEKFHPGSLLVYEMPGNLPLYVGVNYVADPLTGKIVLTQPLPANTHLSADYYYAGESSGPFVVEENGANNSVLPGVVIAFGRRAFDGDVMAIGVTRRRSAAAREYGGRWEMSVDLDVIARDVHVQGEISDKTLMYLHTELRDRLSFEGIEIDSVTSGGESEEPYDENGDDYFYTSSISLTILTNWAIHLPLGQQITRILPGTLVADQIAAGLSDDQLLASGITSGIRATEQLGLTSIQDPWYRDRTANFEIIR